ncbi:MAG: hypothetical protein EP329_27475 [Deltaproteobacteria bacterium]|nr:MAG: hypothetical protein EP329_27475 [Deltaproteobacteria bacterium]
MSHSLTWPRPLLSLLALGAALPALGAARCGGPISSTTPAPDVNGAWSISYDDTVAVRVTLGGAVYAAEIGVNGGQVTIDHNGTPFTFDLDCARPEVVCPSEVWPATVTLAQRNATYPHRFWATLPFQQCDSELVAPADDECGAGTLNPGCDEVCGGTITLIEAERFGVIDEPGESFDLLLGAGLATNGINCALLGASSAHGTLTTVGGSDQASWTATAIPTGTVKTVYAGGCLWAGDPDDDGSLEAIVLNASVELTTGFSGARQ